MPWKHLADQPEEARPLLLGPVNGNRDVKSTVQHRDENIEAIRRHSLRILIVDDHDVFRRSFAARLISFYRAEVVEVASGYDALHVAVAQVFHLILIDIVMPGMDGIATVEALRGVGVGTPIVLMSADYSADQRAAAAALGLVVIVKPIESAQLEQVLLTHCGGLAS
jgi:CheY-like chemotaxis protein